MIREMEGMREKITRGDRLDLCVPIIKKMIRKAAAL